MPKPNGPQIAKQIAERAGDAANVQDDIQSVLNEAVAAVNTFTRVTAQTRRIRGGGEGSATRRKNRLNDGYTDHIRWDRTPNGIRLNVEELNTLTQVQKSRNAVWLIQEVGTGSSAQFIGVTKDGRRAESFPVKTTARTGHKISPVLQWHTGSTWARPRVSGGSDQLEDVRLVEGRFVDYTDDEGVVQRRAALGALPVFDADGRPIGKHRITIRREHGGKDIVRDAGLFLQRYIRSRIGSD